MVPSNSCYCDASGNIPNCSFPSSCCPPPPAYCYPPSPCYVRNPYCLPDPCNTSNCPENLYCPPCQNCPPSCSSRQNDPTNPCCLTALPSLDSRTIYSYSYMAKNDMACGTTCPIEPKLNGLFCDTPFDRRTVQRLSYMPNYCGCNKYP